MTDAAVEARRAYKRKWARENRDKVKAQQARYWAKKAMQLEKEAAGEGNTSDIETARSGGADGAEL